MQVGSTTCQPCNPGEYSHDGIPCTTCPRIQSLLLRGLFSIIAYLYVIIGVYQPNSNSARCLNCPEGRYSNSGSLSCFLCGAGKSSKSGGSCFSCPADTYQPINNSISINSSAPCLSCPFMQCAKPGSTECFSCNPGWTYRNQSCVPFSIGIEFVISFLIIYLFFIDLFWNRNISARKLNYMFAMSKWMGFN